MFVCVGTVRILSDGLFEESHGRLVVAPLHRGAALIEQRRLRRCDKAQSEHEDR